MIRVLIWAAGYSGNLRRVFSRDAQEHLATEAQLKKVGAAVLLACLIAPVNWALGSLQWTGGASLYVQWGVAAAAALAGLLVILVLDRSAVYALDTMGPGQSRAKLYVMLRIVMILVIGFFTAERVLPIVLSPELHQTLLDHKTRSTSERQTRLAKAFALPTTEASAKAATENRVAAEAALNEITPPVAEAQRRATVCWTSYNVRRASVEVSRPAERSRLAGMRRDCQAQSADATRLLDDLRSDRLEALDLARQQEASATSALLDTQSKVRQRAAEEQKLEEVALVPDSSEVLWELLKTSTGARIKFILFMSVILLWETLPLTTKVMFGQSVTGTNIGYRKHSALLELADSHEADLARYASGKATRDAFLGAVEVALQSKELMDEFTKQIGESAAAMAPFEVAIQILRRAEQSRVEMNEIIRRQPELAPMAFRVWQEAARKAFEAVANQYDEAHAL